MKKMVLMLCLVLSGVLCYASGAAGTENEKGEGIPIEIKDSMGSLSGSEGTKQDEHDIIIILKTSIIQLP